MTKSFSFMKYILYITLLFFAAVFESLYTTIPLIVMSVLLLYVVWRDRSLFIIAFWSGIVFDTLSVEKIGASSIFLVVFLFLVVLYERKFEIDTIYFVLFATFLGSFGIGILFSYPSPIIYSGVSAIIAGTVFAFVSLFRKKAERHF